MGICRDRWKGEDKGGGEREQKRKRVTGWLSRELPTHFTLGFGVATNMSIPSLGNSSEVLTDISTDDIIIIVFQVLCFRYVIRGINYFSSPL